MATNVNVTVAILDKVPLFRGGKFEVPTLPTLGMTSRRLAKISRQTGIVATSDKSASVLAAVVSCLVVARLARSLLTYCYRLGGVRGWWWDIGASAPVRDVWEEVPIPPGAQQHTFVSHKPTTPGVGQCC